MLVCFQGGSTWSPYDMCKEAFTFGLTINLVVHTYCYVAASLRYVTNAADYCGNPGHLRSRTPSTTWKLKHRDTLAAFELVCVRKMKVLRRTIAYYRLNLADVIYASLVGREGCNQ